jgi:hypothetical protein
MTSWINLATATMQQKLTGNVPTMESAEKCVWYTKQLARCDESYIGQTQQKLKDQMGQHLNDVKKLITKGIKSDSFVSHFAHHCKKEVKPTSDELCKMMKVKIVWQGNMISCIYNKFIIRRYTTSFDKSIAWSPALADQK